ncbi:MAG: GTPase HflX, partial [Rhodospirillales bacterium]|nr:GTPase HflX [Rhodospirillales bacterium]
QRGGFGFMGGPGETQIETDRRLIGNRITKLKLELAEVKRTRTLHRQARKRNLNPVVALVGYTNAGKSTLFNQLTKANVSTKDQVFATLDPTMRGLNLPSGRKVILSDTVGFVSDLPHELVNAFHATLEEVNEANIIVHVRDAAHSDTDSQKEDVLVVLRQMGITDEMYAGVIEVLNKVDLLSPEDREVLVSKAGRDNQILIPVSALSGEGCSELLQALDGLLSQSMNLRDITLDLDDGASLAWLYDHGEVIDRHDDDRAIHIKVRLDPANSARFDLRRSRHPH